MTTEQAPLEPSVIAEAAAIERPIPVIKARAALRQTPEPTLLPDRTPDLVGLALPDARQEARSAGFSVTVTVWETKIGPWGHVLSQQPMSGTAMEAGNAIRVVMAGRPHVTLPDLRGRDAHAAVVELRRLGLVPGGREERRSLMVPDGSIVATRPSGGSLVVDGSAVVLVVSRGAAEGRARP